MHDEPVPGISGNGPGDVLAFIISNGGATRTLLETATGLSRPTIADRVRTLSGAGLVKTTSRRMASGGRPAALLELNERAFLCLCVDIGETRARIAVTDLRATVLADAVVPVAVQDGPETVIAAIVTSARALLEAPEIQGEKLGGVGIGLPAPVDFGTGRTMGWSVMSGWEGYDIKSRLVADFQVPVFVDNDVNLLLLAEHRLHWPTAAHLLYVKVGTGIGSGLVVDGHVNRGDLGAAGDIGHTRVPGSAESVCRCGNRGCLESLAGGWALARDLREADPRYADAQTARDVVEAIQRGNLEAMSLIRDAGRIVGQSVAFATSLLNPAVIVIGGELAKSGDELVAGVRELVYQQSLPLATKDLVITLTKLDESAGVVGAAILVADALLDPQRIDAMVK